MKLVRFGEPGQEKPGIWLETAPECEGAGILDIRAMAFDIEDFDRHFYTRHGMERLQGLLAESRRTVIPADGIRLGPPLAPGASVLCIGKNYADHAREFDAQTPDAPLVFSKAPGSVTGPGDPIRIPAGTEGMDAEAELAVVIGREARHIAEAEAMDVIAGYTAVNDVTDRIAQKAASQWFRGKSRDTFCPCGPWIVTADEMTDPGSLQVTADWNDRRMQDGNTRDLLFPIPVLIAHITATMTLYPGDIIATGTPAGVGFARNPPVYLKNGDTVTVSIEGVGTLINPVIEED